MLKFIWLIFTSWIIAGCEKEQPDFMATTPVNSLRYLALGDSYTIGESVSATERFPYLTVKLLRQHQISIADPEYIATTGWTTINLINAILERRPKGPYDVVTLLVGVNDQYQRLDTAGYRLRFTQLLDSSILLVGNRASRVFVLSIPDYSATPFVPSNDKARVSKEIDAFNHINKMISLQYNVAYIDITTSSREAASDITLLANDRLHYSSKEHQKWADLLLPYLKSVL